MESADNHTGYGRSLTGEESFSMERVTLENKRDITSKVFLEFFTIPFIRNTGERAFGWGPGGGPYISCFIEFL